MLDPKAGNKHKGSGAGVLAGEGRLSEGGGGGLQKLSHSLGPLEASKEMLNVVGMCLAKVNERLAIASGLRFSSPKLKSAQSLTESRSRVKRKREDVKASDLGERAQAPTMFFRPLTIQDLCSHGGCVVA